MQPTRSCPACQQEVATADTCCPRCSQPLPEAKGSAWSTGNKAMLILLLGIWVPILALVLLVLFLSWLFAPASVFRLLS